MSRIVTERLVLRAYEPSDVARLVEILGNFEVSKWLAKIPHPFTSADVRLDTDDGSSRWPDTAAITLDGVLVGAVSATPDHMGYFLDPAYHGRGIATEAARAMVARVFEETDADRILSGYFEGNPGSARVLEKLGFAERDRYPHPCLARGHDMPNVDMVLTRAAWAKMYEAQP